MLILVVLAMAASEASPVAPMDPLAAADGKVECYQPDDEKRTCRSIASYQRTNDQTYANTAIVLVSSAGPVTLETVTPVAVKAGAVCGSIRADDIGAGKLRVAGRLLPEAEAAPVLSQIAESMAPLIDREICTSYEPSEAGLTAKATIAGVYQADADQRVKWVAPDEGYVVAP